ncbi:MAG TPA: nuclear transport factor 2 family protein [Steroidobacteraceae bacterium]|nr:nuclear transport factor 2 family protein [Steroidobacteraceae bacterium]
MSESDVLQEVADRQQITDLIYRYCRAVDRIDVELGCGVFHEDGVAELEGFYRGSGRGFIEKVCAQHRGVLAHSHQVSNVIVELDGERAGSEAYVTATLRLRDGERLRQIMVWSRYIDRWSKRDGRWGIDRRVAIRDFDEVREVVALSLPGRRDASDPSYEVLRRTR